jgi:hypothetical protein
MKAYSPFSGAVVIFRFDLSSTALPESGFFMLKKDFFAQYHERLSHDLPLTAAEIATIRSFSLGPKKYTRGQIAQWARIKIRQPSRWSTQSRKGRREHSREYYLHILEFVSHSQWSDWKDLLFTPSIPN